MGLLDLSHFPTRGIGWMLVHETPVGPGLHGNAHYPAYMIFSLTKLASYNTGIAPAVIHGLYLGESNANRTQDKCIWLVPGDELYNLGADLPGAEFQGLAGLGVDCEVERPDKLASTTAVSPRSGLPHYPRWEGYFSNVGVLLAEPLGGVVHDELDAYASLLNKSS